MSHVRTLISLFLLQNVINNLQLLLLIPPPFLENITPKAFAITCAINLKFSLLLLPRYFEFVIKHFLLVLP
jgi:hypothetical protein